MFEYALDGHGKRFPCYAGYIAPTATLRLPESWDVKYPRLFSKVTAWACLREPEDLRKWGGKISAAAGSQKSTNLQKRFVPLRGKNNGIIMVGSDPKPFRPWMQSL
jgi:hypothetical protein